MLAGTLVYINAGTQLAQINSLSGIVSPGLLPSFGVLGVFPMLAKKLMALLQSRRVYAKWQRPKTFDRNPVVIGGGAAGLVTSYIAAAVKAEVTVHPASASAMLGMGFCTDWHTGLIRELVRLGQGKRKPRARGK